jgi:uncharacterized protein YutE (UPF0331/DUF86 family)
MTPRRLDPDMVRAKLDAIEQTRTTLNGIGPVTEDDLKGDPITAAAVERLLARLVDLAVDINSHVAAARLGRAPGDYRESFDLGQQAGLLARDLADELKASVGLRNVIVHEYVRLDLRIVADAIPQAVTTYGRYVAAVAGSLTAIPDDR